MFYELARRYMFGRDAEWAHDFALGNLRRFANTPLSMAWSQSVADKPVNFLGIDFKNPVGLAAGLDKNAEWILCCCWPRVFPPSTRRSQHFAGLPLAFYPSAALAG